MRRDKLIATHYENEGVGTSLWYECTCQLCHKTRQIKLQFIHGSRAHERYEHRLAKIEAPAEACDCYENDDSLD